MRRIAIILLAVVTAAGPAGAGAWLRDEGAAFVSVIGTARRGDPDATFETSVYGEYGLTPGLTLGFDLNERPGIAGHALMFARLPLGAVGRRTKLAVEIGLGGHHWQGAWDPMYKLTLSLGRGFYSRWGFGWLALDAAYERRLGNPDPIYKLDATLGLAAPRRVNPILQIETARIRNHPMIWAVAPGLLIEGRKGTAWLIGIERKSVVRDTIGVKFGLWRRF